jgi:hypothetical protein
LKELDRSLPVEAVRLPKELQALLTEAESQVETLLRRKLTRLFPELGPQIIRNGFHLDNISL